MPSVLNPQSTPARDLSPGGRSDVLENNLSLKSGHACPSVVVVDPSCFSLPYDYSLCDALVRQGCKVTLAQSEFTYDKWELPGTFDVWKHFYRHTGRRAGGTSNKKMWKLAKGAEHAFSMRSFGQKLPSANPTSFTSNGCWSRLSIGFCA